MTAVTCASATSTTKTTDSRIAGTNDKNHQGEKKALLLSLPMCDRARSSLSLISLLGIQNIFSRIRQSQQCMIDFLTTVPRTRNRAFRRHGHYIDCDHHHDSLDSYPLDIRKNVGEELVSLSSRGGSTNQKQDTGASLWPPWPFNLLFHSSGNLLVDSPPPSSSSSYSQSSLDNHYYSNNQYHEQQPSNEWKTKTSWLLPNMQLFISYLRLKAKGGFEQMQQVGSALSFHLPPAAPCLVLLAMLPTQWVDKVNKGSFTAATAAATTATSTSTTFSYFPNVLAKRLALASLSIAILSWADHEVRYKKKLTPLPLLPEYRDVKRAILPPFLPEVTPVIVRNEMDKKGLQVLESQPLEDDMHLHLHTNMNNNNNNTTTSISTSTSTPANGNVQSSLKTSMMKMYQRAASKPQRLHFMMQSWRNMNRIRQQEEMEMKRRQIMDELIIWRELKKQRERMYQKGYNERGASHQDSREKNGKSTSPLGYALVTGASRGIGRALAVELARWDIPLILVARDAEKLNSVANEIEAAYGVNCCVIPADLSNPQVAQQIYRATEDAGLRVDILVNNAGVCSRGDFTDNSQDDIAQMMNVNVCAVTHLSHLYGQNMKRQGRGRILFVSSVIGATPGGPGVATYAATKSYEKSLAQSMGRELEKYGVGVTCIMPGAVKGTDFAVNSNCAESACWRFPCYPMSTPNVAARGIRALLSGDSEIIPGWHNRLFLKVFSPLMPQRLTTSIVGFSFSPLKMGMPTLPWTSKSTQSMDRENDPQIIENFHKPPKIIKLQDIDTTSHNQSPVHGESPPSHSTQILDQSGSEILNNHEHSTNPVAESGV